MDRVIPCPDAGNDAKGLAARVTESRRAEIDVLAGYGGGYTRVVLEAVRAGEDINGACFLYRLTGIARFKRSDLRVSGP